MAETRTIRTVLEMNVSRFQANVRTAQVASRNLASELDKISKATGKTREDFSRAGTTMLGAGTAIAGGIGLAAKAAIDWESAWAGVTKTTNGTAKEMGVLEGQLRELARTLPASHEEIAAVAEAAGQLGIKREDIAGFTKVMIDLGETTNLTADEAATQLARFSNIMGTASSDVDRLGSSLVGLGNNFATTEGEILAMSMRLAGTGRQMNMSEGDVLGLAAAMSSVGIEAEAGGTAMSTVMKKIDAAVRNGGESLDEFARVSGMSASEFSAAWKSDPAQALVAFTSGLNDVKASGESVNAVLSGLHISGIRETDTMLRLSGAHEVLAEAIASGNREFVKNTALLAEANKRYATTESQMKIAFNNIVDAGIDLGGTVLPIIAEVASGAADMAKAFSQLPDPVKSSIVQFGALAAAGLIASGGLLKIVPAARDTLSAFKTLKAETPKLGKAIGLLGKALGAAGLIATLTSVGQAMSDFTVNLDELSVKTSNLAESAEPIKDIFEGMVPENISKGREFAEYLERLANPGLIEGIDNITANISNLWDPSVSGWDDERERIDQFGQSLQNLAEIDLTAAQDSFTRLWETTGKSREAGENLLKVMPAFRGELVSLADANKLATDDATLLAIALGEIPVNADLAKTSVGEATEELSAMEQATEDAKTALDELNGAMQDTGSAFLSVREAARGWEDVVAKMAAGEFARAWDDGTEAARKNAEQMDQNAEAALRYVDALTRSGELTSESLESIRGDLIEQAEKFGATREEAEAYVDALGLTPDKITTVVDIETQEAQGKIDAYTESVGHVPPMVLTEAGLESELATAKMTELQQGLYSLDQSSANPDVAVTGADQAKADVDAVRAELSNMPPAVQTILTMDNSGAVITAEETKVLLNQIPDLEVYSTLDLTGLETNANKADLRIAVLSAQEADPTATLSTDQLVRSANAAVTRLNEIDGMKPTPALLAEKRVLERVVSSAKSDLASIPDETLARVLAQTSGTGDVRALRDAIGSVSGKSVTVSARATGFSALSALRGAIARVSGFAYGGWVPGRAAGGWVPGTYPGPGVDNVLWPLKGAAGGGYLTQPLAGGEFVMPTRRARQYAGELESMRAGTYRGVGPSVSVSNSFSGVDEASAEIIAERTLRDMTRAVRRVIL